jgi:hypothetical protein
LREDAKPQKVMHKNIKLTKVIIPRMVTKNIPSKPQKDHNSKLDQERRVHSHNRLNQKGAYHLK